MQRFTACFFLLLISVFALSANPAIAYENDNEAPAAFVEGTGVYTISYFDKILARIRDKFAESDLYDFEKAIAEVKSLNVRLTLRIEALRANKDFLKDKDPEFLQYREALAKTTNIMFGLLRKLNERTALPSR